MDINNKYVIYSLTDRGLFSELSNMLAAIIYSKQHERMFVLNTYNWKARVDKGWTDYFEDTIECENSILTSQSSLFTTNWKRPFFSIKKKFFDILNRIALVKYNICFSSNVYQHLSNIEDGKYMNDYKDQIANYARELIRLNSKSKQYIESLKKSINLPVEYIGVHIRRGDKITTNEMEDISLEKYLSAINDAKKISKNVYIATDDTSIIEYIKFELAKENVKIFTNNTLCENGYNQTRFNRADKTYRYDITMNTLADAFILCDSKYFIGTYSSNLSRFVALKKGFEKCKSLDVQEWYI